MNGRSTLDIELDVLMAIAKYQKLTHIMYAANLPWYQMKKAIVNLEAQGLIESLKPTKKGWEILQAWQIIRREFPHRWLEQKAETWLKSLGRQ